MKNRISEYLEQPVVTTMTRLLCGCSRCGRRLVDVSSDGRVLSRQETFALVDSDQELAEVLCRDCAEKYAERARENG